MNLKPIIVALVGVGVVGSAFAATNSTANHTKATPAWQGNSVMAPVQNKIGNSGAYVGVMGNIDAALNDSAFLKDSVVVGNPATSHKTNSQFFINNANVFAGFSSQTVDALVNVRYDNRPAILFAQGNRNALGVDEAFVAWHSADNAYYAKIGKFYNAFGSYNPYAFIYSPTQMFSQVNGTGLELGASMNGVFANASLYSPNSQFVNLTTSGQRNVDNASFNLGYSNSDFGTFKVGYLLDARTTYAREVADLGLTSGSKDIGAISVNANLAGSQLAGFSGGFNYLYLEGKNLGLVNTDGAWFMGFNGAYAFSGLTQQDSFGLGFDMASDSITKDTANLLVPKYQLTANYGVQINKWVGAGLTYAYSRFDTATKVNGNTFGLRLSTAF